MEKEKMKKETKARIGAALLASVLTTGFMFLFLSCMGFFGGGPLLDGATISASLAEEEQKPVPGPTAVANTNSIHSETESNARSAGFTFEKQVGIAVVSGETTN